MANAKKLPSGKWRTLAYGGKDETGKRIYKSFTSADKKQSEFLAAEYELKHKAENKSSKLTFQKAADRYIENKTNLLSPATIRGYRIMQKNCFDLMLNKELESIFSSDIIQKQMNENAKEYASKSLKNQFGFISAVMGYHKYHIDNVTLKPSENKSLKVPTKSESLKIMKLLESAPEIECQVLLALTCSLRQSEIAAIKTEDINGDQIFIHAALVPNENNEWIYKLTNKTKASTRTIDMPKYLSKKIAKIAESKKDGYIFNTSPIVVLKRFKKLLRENGMPEYTIHSLRHCFAATLHAQNVPDKYVMKMGGWASDHVLKKVYQYAFDDETSKIKVETNKYFDSILNQDATQKATQNKNT